jgi:hypothetical protein
MYGAHKQFFEISRLMQGDPEGNSLMEEVLNACLDYSLVGIDTTPEPDQDKTDQLIGLMAALERCNTYISGRFSSFEEGLFQGADREVSLWSDDLTFQILANRPN